MTSPLKLLLVEDNEDDAELILRELRRGGYYPTARRVDGIKGTVAALESGPWDAIICDYGLPTCTGLDVLRTVRARDPHTPFMFVSGTMGEDVAVAAMRAGANDYILKGNLARLEPAVTRELRDAAERREHRRVAGALADAEARLGHVFESDMLGIVFWRADGYVFRANAEYLRLTGYTQDDVRLGGVEWHGMIPEQYAAVKTRIFEELKARGSSASAEVEILTKDGGTRPVLVGAAMLKAGGEEGAAILLDMSQHVADLEARRVLEAQLRQAQKMELVARLAGGVAHDFNNLFAVVMLGADVVREETAESAHSILDDITHAATQGAALTRQLLALGRQQALDLRLVDVNDLIRGQESLLRRLTGEPVVLDLALSPDMGPIKVDPAQFEQVILNLCVNARDAMPDGGQLTIRTRQLTMATPFVAADGLATPGSYVTVSVTDTGSGMDLQTQERIFEPFFSTKPAGRGTGLGLAVVHGILSQSQGHIAVTSSPGHGTTFTVYFPVAPEGVRSQAGVVKRAPKVAGDEVILLTEDDVTLRAVVMRALKGAGYTVLAAAEAGEALAMAAQFDGRIHLLLTDVVLPGQTGPQLAEALWRDRPATRVVFMSGYMPEHVSRQGALVDGRFLAKPFTMADLTRKVRDTLDEPA